MLGDCDVCVQIWRLFSERHLREELDVAIVVFLDCSEDTGQGEGLQWGENGLSFGPGLFPVFWGPFPCHRLSSSLLPHCPP